MGKKEEGVEEASMRYIYNAILLEPSISVNFLCEKLLGIITLLLTAVNR